MTCIFQLTPSALIYGDALAVLQRLLGPAGRHGGLPLGRRQTGKDPTKSIVNSKVILVNLIELALRQAVMFLTLISEPLIVLSITY
jgi:hypothetical protein